MRSRISNRTFKIGPSAKEGGSEVVADPEAYDFDASDFDVSVSGDDAAISLASSILANSFMPLVFGDDSDEVKDKFLLFSGNDNTSVNSSYIALADGFVRHVTLDTAKNATNDWDLQIILNAVKGGAGIFSGGTQSGGDLNKTTGVLTKSHLNLGTAHPFSQGDKISARVKKGTFGSGKAVEPAVILWIEFTGVI